MSTRVGIPGTKSGLDTDWEIEDVNGLPGGWLAYVEATSNPGSSIGTSTTDLTGLSTGNFTVNTNRRIKITGFIPTITKSTNAEWVKVLVRDSSNVIKATIFNETILDGNRATCYGAVCLNLSGGTYSFKLSGLSEAGTATFVATALGDPGPAWLLVEDIGPS